MLIIVVLSMMLSVVFLDSTEAAALEKQRGSITFATGSFGALTNPSFIETWQPNMWSNIGYIDLTNQTRIPPNARVTNIIFNYGQSSGSFSLPERAVFNENGDGYYVNIYNGQTSDHHGEFVRQEWSVRFWTQNIRVGPARIWPTVTFQYEY